MSPSAISTPTRPNHRAPAALAIGTACFVSTLHDTVMKVMAGAYPFHQIQSIRCGVALVCVTAYAIVTGHAANIRTPHWPLAATRGLLLGAASTLFYLAAVAMPLPEAVALYFTMPLWVAVLAGPFLGERQSPARWLAVLVGFAGVATIIRPGTSLFEPAALLALAAALLYAIGNALTRPLATHLAAAPLAFWQNAAYVVIALALSAAFGTGKQHTSGHVSLDYLTRGWTTPSTSDLALMLGLGLATGLLMLLFTTAYRLAETSFVAPFEYSAMLWAVLFSFLVWHQLPDATAFVGILLIAGSGLFLIAAER